MENRLNENDRVLFRIIYLLRRLTDRWASVNLSRVAAQDFNVTFLPYFMNIGDEGVSNHDLVKTIKVTKQGVSKTVKELENLGLVYTEKSDTDARSIMIYLTETGRTLFNVIKEHSDDLHNEYRKLVGTKNFELMVDTLVKIIDFHERIEKEVL
ncbi:MarR family transcriptional regulator [Pedobacter nutrimenti]|uniref:MarR family winged helix-turn-helix transcriptional regulator n=1 Tax=Pedobacter nutrimenti TaxID=1241337 RepID=UPI00292D05D5|nr:MarR family transcriptional regulator [Pedobacter nutrimenti]